MSDGLIKTVLRLWDSVVTDWADDTDGANKKIVIFVDEVLLAGTPDRCN